MIKVAPDLFLIPCAIGYTINAYLSAGVLIDTGARFSAPLLRRALKGTPPEKVVLTHEHPDHQGGAASICQHYGIPLWCSRDARGAVESGDLTASMPANLITRCISPLLKGPGNVVESVVQEGDRVGNFYVLETPGHSPGHISLFRESDRVLILGDLLANMNPVSGRTGLREPPEIFNLSPEQNRSSLKRVAALEPAVICFGHGPPLFEGSEFVKFVERLN